MGSKLFFFLCVLVSLAANPKKASVKAGRAAIIEKGSTLEIKVPHQTVIHWESFSIEPHETTRFYLPSPNAAVLNQVTGVEMSKLLGKLQADGKVYLINPNGIIVGKDAVINTAGFLASTLNVQMKEFLDRGDLHFFGNSSGVIENLGTIYSATGPVVLLAYQVKNGGKIEAPFVSVNAGSEFLVKPTGDVEIFIRPNSESYIDQEGAIEGLTTKLQTDGAGALAINCSGIIQADQIERVGGKVFLRASEGSVRMTSDAKIVAPSGEVAIEAKHLQLEGIIDAPEDQISLKGEQLNAPQNRTFLMAAMLGAGPPVTITLGGGALIATAGTTAVIQTSFVLSGTGSASIVPTGDLEVNSDVTANNVNLTLQAGQNLQIADSITSANGNLTLIGGVNVNAPAAVSITTTGTGSLTLVADNQFSTPKVGTGIINIASGSTLTTAGGDLRIYTNDLSNVYPATINGSAPPGTPTLFTYYPMGSGGVPFQVFYKGVDVPSTQSAELSTSTSLMETLPSQETLEDEAQESSPTAIQTPDGLSTQNSAPCQ